CGAPSRAPPAPERRFRIGRHQPQARSCRIAARYPRAVSATIRSAMMFKPFKTFAAAMAVAAAVSAPLPATAQEKTVTVFAAASMKNALDDINAAFTKATNIKVVASYAASSALMKQIEEGAPADIFASADLEWMD